MVVEHAISGKGIFPHFSEVEKFSVPVKSAIFAFVPAFHQRALIDEGAGFVIDPSESGADALFDRAFIADHIVFVADPDGLRQILQRRIIEAVDGLAGGLLQKLRRQTEISDGRDGSGGENRQKKDLFHIDRTDFPVAGFGIFLHLDPSSKSVSRSPHC